MSLDPRPVSPVTFAEKSKLTQTQAGFHRIKIGGIDVVALSDGTFRPYLRDQMRNITPEEVEAILAKSHQKSPIHTSVNAFLIELGDRLLMVDAGTGEVLGPQLNKLNSSLRAIGREPEDITDILVTHIHPDHSGGLTVGGQKIYPNAKVHVNKKELDFWASEENSARAAGHAADWFKVFEATVRPYLTDGMVYTYDGEVELFPGIHTEQAYGHTPGQVAYVLEDDGEKISFWGDVINFPDVQFEEPTVSITFDIDQEKATAQRLSYLSDAAEHGYLVAMPHAHFPGVGHVQRLSGDHFRWIPIPYVNDVVEG
jgi:glyoxylase-like metal-dependent hydrolase (beta-lactamase superfamily II)